MVLGPLVVWYPMILKLIKPPRFATDVARHGHAEVICVEPTHRACKHNPSFAYSLPWGSRKARQRC